jgi:hypothetical protein
VYEAKETNAKNPCELFREIGDLARGKSRGNRTHWKWLSLPEKNYLTDLMQPSLPMERFSVGD